jgi:hypothetical protein
MSEIGWAKLAEPIIAIIAVLLPAAKILRLDIMTSSSWFRSLSREWRRMTATPTSS